MGNVTIGKYYYWKEEYEKAFPYFEKAVNEENDAYAKFMLSIYYNSKLPIEKRDNETAFQYAKEAVEQGCSEALIQLGQFYFHGIATEKNTELGLEYIFQAWFRGRNRDTRRLYYQYITELNNTTPKLASHAPSSVVNRNSGDCGIIDVPIHRRCVICLDRERTHGGNRCRHKCLCNICSYEYRIDNTYLEIVCPQCKQINGSYRKL